MTPHALRFDLILEALARGDHALADRLAAMPDDELAALAPRPRPEAHEPPPEVGRWLLEHGFTGTVTDAAGRKRTYSDGKQVAGQHPDDAEGAGAGTDPPPEAVDGVVAGLADDPAVKGKPGLLAKVKARVGTAMKTAAYMATHPKSAAYALAYHAPQILGAWTDVFDHPDDLKKIGYNPSFGNVDHRTADPVKDHVGIPAHMAAGLVVKVGAAVVAALKAKLAGKRTEADQDADPQAVAEFLHEILAAVAKGLGLSNPPSAEEIAARLAG